MQEKSNNCLERSLGERSAYKRGMLEEGMDGYQREVCWWRGVHTRGGGGYIQEECGKQGEWVTREEREERNMR